MLFNIWMHECSPGGCFTRNEIYGSIYSAYEWFMHCIIEWSFWNTCNISFYYHSKTITHAAIGCHLWWMWWSWVYIIIITMQTLLEIAESLKMAHKLYDMSSSCGPRRKRKIFISEEQKTRIGDGMRSPCLGLLKHFICTRNWLSSGIITHIMHL